MNFSRLVDSKIFRAFIAAARKNPLTTMLITLGIVIVSISLIIAWKDTSGSVIGALLGSTITSFVTIIGIIIASILNERTRQRETFETSNNYKKTLASEIKSLWDAYMKGIGNLISNHQTGNPFLVYYPVHEKYFTVYENTPHMLCLLDEKTRTSVINAYTRGKGLLDCYRYNNMLYERLHHIYAISSIPGVDINKCQVMQNEILKGMAEYVEVLREYHQQAEDYMTEAYRLLQP